MAHLQKVICCLLAAGFFAAEVPSKSAESDGNFERPPTVRLRDLIKTKLPTVPGIRLQEEVPTDGVMGTFVGAVTGSPYRTSAAPRATKSSSSSFEKNASSLEPSENVTSPDRTTAVE